MLEYYRERAPVYDRVYRYPERQVDLQTLSETVSEYFRGNHVLEIAAGTGYWTPFIALNARSVHATDGNDAPLEQLRHRVKTPNVTTQVLDAYDLGSLTQSFDAAFAGLWLSHVTVQDRPEWLAALHACLAPGAKVMLMDNSEAQCQRLPIVATDDAGNTFQDRTTDDGQTYRVLKNFPSESELLNDIGSVQDASYSLLDHFWCLSYRLR